MKIAIISLQFEETATGGGGVHVENICKQFIALSNEVTVISIHTKRTLRNIKLESLQTPSSMEKRCKLTIIRFLIEKGIEQPYVGSKKEELQRIKQFADAVVKWIVPRIEKFDVISLQGHHILPGLIAKKLKHTGVKIVSTIHALESTFVSQKGESLGSFDATKEMLSKLRTWEAMSQFADFIILNSPSVRDEYLKILKQQGFEPQKFAKKTKVISSGCNADFLMSDEEINHKLFTLPEKINLVTFCRIDPSKGMEFSIEGAKEAAKMYSGKLCLFIIGIPASEEYLNKLYSKTKQMPSNLEIKFHLTSAISPPPKKKQILDDKHIYVMPTLKEPFGMSIIEASARGNMIVSTDTTGPAYMMEQESNMHYDWGIITNYGVLARIAEDHHKNLAKNIGKAIVWSIKNWEGGAERITAFNEKIREKWTWEGIAKQYLKLFESQLVL